MPARTSCSACAIGPDCDQQVILREPCTRGAIAGERCPRSGLDALRHAAQRELAQGNQVRFAEEPLDGRAGLLRDVDLASMQTREEIVGRQVDELDLVGLVEDAIGQCLALLGARDLRDKVVETLEMLNVQRRPNVDAGVEQLFDILPTFRMARRRLAAHQVRVRELVDEQDPGSALERRVEIELLPYHPAVADGQRGQTLERQGEPLRLGAAVRLDVTDDDFGAAGARPVPRLSIAKVLPTPAVAPKKIRNRPRRARASSALTCASSSSGSGRVSTCHYGPSSPRVGVERQIQLEHVDARLAEHAEGAPLGVLATSPHLGRRQAAGSSDPRDLILRRGGRCADRGRCSTR